MTAQVCDSITFEGEVYPLHSDPLFTYLREKKLDNKFVAPHTACWRGYIADWEIFKGKLYLIGLCGYVDEGNNIAKKVGMECLFPREKKVHAKWFSGEIRIEKGELIESANMGFESKYEQEILITVEHGIVKNIPTVVTNRVCVQCGTSLLERPKIQIGEPGNEREFCFTCAKQVVESMEEAAQKKAEKEYFEALKEWGGLSNEERERKKDDILVLFFKFFGAAISLFMIVGVLQGDNKGELVFLIPIVLFVSYILFSKNSKDKNPKNDSLTSRPTRRTVQINHHPAKVKDIHANGYNRQKIIQRDNGKCQWCGKGSPEVRLEVHHVIPVAQGGSDAIENLITLCIECHKKENWYGHVHKYAESY